MQLLAESSSKQRIKLIIKGIVQGVGFRPFIYQLATKYSLSGFVSNNGFGVVVEVEGGVESCELFLNNITKSTPPLSRIDSINKEQIAPKDTTTFEIVASNANMITTLLSPDISLCDECLAEIQDKTNRRYNYPFINCTNCGPRYTIIENLPYDRANTTMRKFTMCKVCKIEYNDPKNRRYHAQPISCYECGPRLNYLSLEGVTESKNPIEKICSLIQEGEVVAIKGVGGFHIVCDATNNRAIATLREKKVRPTKPLAVMFPNIEAIKEVATLTKEDKKLILSKERPIVIVSKKENSFVSELIAPNINRIGVFLAYSPLHKLILKRLNFPIVATSANLSGEPIILDEKEIFAKLPHLIKHLLTYDRVIVNACDDSVLQTTPDNTIMLRMARGYAPFSLPLQQKTTKKILALGANQKATITLAFGQNIVLSPYIGDLGSINSTEHFLKMIETFKRVYNFEPDIIVCDKHPHYESTKLAKKYVATKDNLKLIEIQHHYAHSLATMAEFSLDEKVLAFCFDGTGYGDDGTLWGGEVLLASPQNYERLYHFKTFPLLGGEKAIKEPKRVALALLFEQYSLDEVLAIQNNFNANEIKLLHQLYTKGLNTPQSSSVGRLFDGVYALCGYTQNLNYEGESGLILESLKAQTQDSYSYTIKNGIIDYTKMIPQILKEKDRATIAKKFIQTLTQIVLVISNKHPNLPVVLSGGVFQNKTLVMQITQMLTKAKRRYYIQNKTPLNDSGISLGQIYFALNNL